MIRKTVWLAALATVMIMNGCGSSGRHGNASLDGIPDFDYSNTYVYDQNSPYANVLKRCISAKKESDICTFATLPLIAQE